MRAFCRCRTAQANQMSGHRTKRFSSSFPHALSGNPASFALFLQDRVTFPAAHRKITHLASIGIAMSATDARRPLYPEIEPFDSGVLQVSPLQKVYYEQSGNPQGKPA